jgi:hypothetical protein
VSELGPVVICASPDRRNAVAAAGGPLNGIDFLELLSPASPGAPPLLNLHFIFDVSAAGLGKDNFAIVGGERITTINVTGVALHAGDVTALDLTIDAEGDFSGYVLVLQRPNQPGQVPDGFDPQLRSVPFRFHLDCAIRFDCKREIVCPPAPSLPPTIDYLAKDYASFRQLILDRMALLAPAWNERNPADAGIALVELIAYAADRLSYRQDAAATEAYLATARLRSSVRRHVRLVDYEMHDGANARAWVRIEVRAPVIGTSSAPAIPAGTRFVTTLPAAPVLLPASAEVFRAISQTGAQIFEAMGPVVSLFDGHNQMPFYNWSATECCLPAGATRGTLRGQHPDLRPGDVLVLAEVRGPNTGNREDADPRRRHPVRLTAVTLGADPLDGTQLTNIDWHQEDALPFPLCIVHSTGSDERRVTVTEVSAALGNIVLVDHGRTAGPPLETLPQQFGTVTEGMRFRPTLPQPYLTFAGQNPIDQSDGTLTGSCAAAGAIDPKAALPRALRVTSTLEIPSAFGGPPEIQVQNWTAVGSLFDPAIADSPHAFVVEVENDGTAFLRFGDGVDGAVPDPAANFAATAYRIGDMSLGNVGAETITHAMIGQHAINRVSNPLAAAGGLAPESMASARTNAPYAFRTQERAVTLADYAHVAMQTPGASVLRAVATGRFTRSWRTILITVELSGGRRLDSPIATGPSARQRLEAQLDLYRMAGVDVEFEDARRIPLELTMHVCVDPWYRRDEVAQSLLQRFSDQILPDGTRGVFYPDNFTIGDPVYLAPLYAAAQSVAGVASVEITEFRRADHAGDDGIARGYLTPGRTEAFTLQNSPDFPEQGTFTLTVEGGR